ncbi:MAG: hypothetical protein IIV61_05140 [Oscillospiraceae bacterium]|jgi:hypothetical protein|nr:hypothetical protein [Oscillospiraceae bacterium]
MLFRKKIPCSCGYCANGTMMDEGQVLCTKYGVVAEKEKCRRFKYDPCKRIPAKPKALDFRKYDEHDFSL